jgi:hypothetical protein
VQHGLQDRARPGVVAAQLGQDGEGRVDRRRLLHVEGHRGAQRAGRLGHRPHQLQRQVVPAHGQRLPEGRQLDRHLRRPAEAERGEAVEGGEVGVPGAHRLPAVGHVLAEVVQGDGDAVGGQRADGGERVGQRLSRDEPVDHPAGHRGAGDHAAQRGPAGRGEQGLLGQHGHLRSGAGGRRCPRR